MELTDAIDLINNTRFSRPNPAVWADLGCGSGLFSFALANILAAGSIVYAIDKSGAPLTKQPNPKNNLIKQQQLDFYADSIGIRDLDGILMANSLHFVKNKTALIPKLQAVMKEDSSFLIVEYDTDISGYWVPYPVSFSSLRQLFEAAGYRQVIKLHERPSAFRASPIYSALISKEVIDTVK